MNEETTNRTGSIIGGLFFFFFGLPFTSVPLLMFFDGAMDPADPFGLLFGIVFSIPFLLAGLFVQYIGISLIWGSIRSPIDPASIPRKLPPGPYALSITEHPDKSYIGKYFRQLETINGRDWYKMSGDIKRLYYYAQNEGGSAGWSLDDRNDSGIRDWFNGGWLPYKGFEIPIGRNKWKVNDNDWVSIEEFKSTEKDEENSEGWWTESFDSRESENTLEKSESFRSSQRSISPINLDSEVDVKSPKYRIIAINIFIFLSFLFFAVPLELLFDDSFDDEDMPDRWCDSTNHYPVTVPITAENEFVLSEELRPIEMENRNKNNDSRLDLVINGGVCSYQYRVADSWGFLFTFGLDNATNIDGVSILVMEHPLGYTSGYSGILIETSTDNGSNWDGQYFSPYMFGEYERDAMFEDRHENFSFNKWNRHKFNSTVSNVTHVRILTGVADQAEDAAVSFSALRVDAEGDYEYPDYLLCDGNWDGRFNNSFSNIIEWPFYDESYYGNLEC